MRNCRRLLISTKMSNRSARSSPRMDLAHAGRLMASGLDLDPVYHRCRATPLQSWPLMPCRQTFRPQKMPVDAAAALLGTDVVHTVVSGTREFAGCAEKAVITRQLGTAVEAFLRRPDLHMPMFNIEVFAPCSTPWQLDLAGTFHIASRGHERNWTAV